MEQARSADMPVCTAVLSHLTVRRDILQVLQGNAPPPPPYAQAGVIVICVALPRHRRTARFRYTV